MKLRCMLVLGLLSIVAPARAQVNNDRDRIQAAHDNAIQLLSDQVDQVRLGHGLTVADILDKTGSQDDLHTILARAQQIGGARWLDEQTCQIRLEISGSLIASSLQKIVLDHAKASPLSPEALAVRLPAIQGKVFTAVGTSTGSQELAGARFLGQADGWAVVSDQARRQAILAARRDAINRVLASVRSVQLSDQSTVGDALGVPSVRNAVEQWLAGRPVIRLEYRSDLQVKLTLSAPADGLFGAFESAAKAQKQEAVPTTAAGWDQVRAQFISKLHHASGRATAVVLREMVSPVAMPQSPPGWVQRQIEAEGSSTPRHSRLKAARAAECSALAHLRSQVEALELTGGLTIADAQKRDPRIAQAVTRALDESRTYKVDYQSDGSARVKVNLDLRDLWDELQSLP